MSTGDYKMAGPARKPVRRRGAEATAAAIVEAARAVFHEKGFDAAGIREIAERAEVNIALINRYFGSKEGLFDTAVLSALSLDGDAWDRIDDIADGVATMLVDKPLDVAFDPVVALLRSLASPVVGPKLCAHVETRIVGPLADRIGGPNARERAGLLTAFIAGYDVTARMMAIDLAGAAGRDALHDRLRRTIRAMLNGA